jgi:hypothetical protein
VRDILGFSLIPPGAAEDLVRTINILIDAKLDQRIVASQAASATTLPT